MAVLDHPVFLGEHVSVSYLFIAAGELTEGLGSQWALLGPDLSCDSMGWSVSTPDPWAGCVEVITHISLPCFLNDPWEELLEHDSEGESEVQMGRFHFTAFSVHHEGKQEPKAGAWWQRLQQRLWRNTTYWLVPQGLLSLLFYTAQDHLPRGGPVQSRLGSPYQSLIKKMPLIFACRPVWWRHLLS